MYYPKENIVNGSVKERGKRNSEGWEGHTAFTDVSPVPLGYLANV